MIRTRVLRPCLAALLALLAFAPYGGRPLSASAAVLAFTVTSTADIHDASRGDGVCADAAGRCTVRAAIEEAGAQRAGSTIIITIPAGTYLLSLGALVVTRNTVTLAGVGARLTALDGQGTRILLVARTAYAKIGGVRLRNGNAGRGLGGALVNLGLASVSRSVIVNDSAQDGGGIYNAPTGRLWLANTSIVRNTAPGGSGGGILNQGALTVSGSSLSRNTAGVGGAIASTGALTLTGSSITTNTATLPCCAGHDGGGIYTSGKTLIINSTIGGNAASNIGGGIDNDSGTVSLTHSALSGNTAPNNGGGIYNIGTVTAANSILKGNTAPHGYGGGIDNEGGTVTLTNSTLSGNTVLNNGGGIDNYGVTTLTDSTLGDNAAFNGGGIDNEGGTVTLTNSTLSGNTATLGGGISNYAAAMLTYVTVASNSSGLYQGTCCGSALALTGTIVANSTGGANCSGPIAETQGYNLDSGASCGLSKPTDLINTNPMLGSLADNGGATPTMALLPGSPAVDRGGTSANGCPATDQRGVSRPRGAACDIGAYEATS